MEKRFKELKHALVLKVIKAERTEKQSRFFFLASDLPVQSWSSTQYILHATRQDTVSLCSVIAWNTFYLCPREH